MDWEYLLTHTELDNKDCIAQNLRRIGINSYAGLQDLPGKHGRPVFCGQSIYAIIEQLNAAFAATAAVPSINEVAQPEPPVESSPPVTQETLLTDLGLELTERTFASLAEAGVTTVGDVLKGGGEHLTEIPGIGETTRDRIVSAVRAALDYQKE